MKLTFHGASGTRSHFALAFIATLCAGVSFAQDDSGQSSSCGLCPPASGWELDVSAGALAVFGDDLYRFGDYTGLDQDGLYASGNIFARYWGDDAEFFRLEGYRLGLDSQAIFAEGGKQGTYQWRASYQSIPRRLFDTTSSPYRASGNQELNLLSGWVRGTTTQSMTQLDSSLQQVKIGRDWDIYNLGAGFETSSRWDFDVNYRHQERDGNAISSGSFFFNAAMFAAPVDDTTDELELTAIYKADTWQVSAAYWGVLFDNNVSSLTWDNPYVAQTPGADSGQLARAPDNDSHQFKLAGSVALPARTMLTGHVSFGRMNQDDEFLPYTTNLQVMTGALPSSSADARVDTTNLKLRVTSSPTRKFTIEGEIRFLERDNRTPQQTFNYVVTDLLNSTDSATNIAYDYERNNYRLRGEYRFTSRTRLHLGYEHENFDRTGQERTETKTNGVWAKLRTRPTSQFNMDVKLYAEDRDGSTYNPNTNVPDPQNPLMRKYNMADRERVGVKANISAYPSDRLSLGLNAEYNDDEYEDSEIGLLDSEYSRLGLDGSYLFRGDASLYGSVYWEDIESTQANSQTFSTPDWTGTTEDRFFTGDLGIRFPEISDRWSADAQYTYTHSEGETTNNTNALVSSFPTLESTAHRFRLGINFRYSESLNLQIVYLYESFDSDDWALEDVEPATVSNLLALGADPWDYDAHVVFVGVHYTFDTRGQNGQRISNRVPY